MPSDSLGNTAPDLPGAAKAIQAGPPAPAGGASGFWSAANGLEVQTWFQSFDQRAYTAQGIENGHSNNTRVVLAYRRQFALGDAVSLTFSDRLDLVQPLTTFAAETMADGSVQHTVNALRELFVGWRGGRDDQPLFVDFGRINLRNGVASGYNPTDFFKADAVVQATTLDPNALREDRLGTVMVRGQQLWEWGAVTLAYAPRLSSSQAAGRALQHHPDFSTDLGLTNRFNAGFAKISPQISQRVSVDGLFYAREQADPQMGLNAAILVGDAVVVDIETTLGRHGVLAGPQQLADAAGQGAAAWRPRASIGATWTTPLGVSLTLEHDYAGDALSALQWRAWRRSGNSAALMALGHTEALRSAEQEPLVQESWFVRLAADRLFNRPGLGASAFAFVNAFDGSTLWQGALSQSVTPHLQATLQVGGYDGGIRSEYGASTLKRYVAAYLSYRL